MGFIDRLFGRKPPQQPKPVERPHQGGGAADAEALYDKLDALKAEKGLPRFVNDTDAWQPQQGFGRELVKAALSDGKISEAEIKALADIADQRYTKYGGRDPNDLPLLAYSEAVRTLLNLSLAPDEATRHWWASMVARNEPVTLADVRDLAAMLLADGKVDHREGTFKYHASNEAERTPIKFTPEARLFLSYIGKTERELRDYKEDPLRPLSADEKALVKAALELTAKSG